MIPTSEKNSGAVYAIAAYSAWGFVPLFWAQLRMFSPVQILAHRILWSLLFFVFIFILRNNLKSWITELRNGTTLKRSLPSSLAIGVNWGLYIYAVNSGHALESSLGYFINPIFNILIGAVFFKEKLNRLQWTAFATAFTGVAWLTFVNGRIPWVALSLAATFSAYGVIRKKTSIKGTTGTATESLILIPLSLVILSSGALAPVSIGNLSDPLIPALLLILGGAVTALPLVWFSEAAQRMPLSTLGFFQYISPTFQFLIAVFVFKEDFNASLFSAFLIIWVGLAIFIYDSARSHFQGRMEPSNVST
ncbi:MAG: EamA family transporter RarD [Betaproteobacteria bacterium]|nr:EamA family transporter RarD [Betaproteobacteria bacterium]